VACAWRISMLGKRHLRPRRSERSLAQSADFPGALSGATIA
jgi:hypothetical protein